MAINYVEIKNQITDISVNNNNDEPPPYEVNIQQETNINSEATLCDALCNTIFECTICCNTTFECIVNSFDKCCEYIWENYANSIFKHS